MGNSPTYLGTVQDVQGATISIVLDVDTVSGLSFIDGHGYRIGQIGSFVRIPIGLIKFQCRLRQIDPHLIRDRWEWGIFLQVLYKKGFEFFLGI